MKNHYGIKALARRIWNSPTLMSWGSLGSRTINIAFILPLVLTRLDAPEIALWYLFRSISDLTGLADFGLEATFVRIISYSQASGGLRSESSFVKGIPSKTFLHKNINTTMNFLFLRVAGITALVMAIGGTLLLRRPIMQTSIQEEAWVAWIVVILSSIFTVFGAKYSVALQGLDRIALWKRWETVRSLGEIITLGVTLLAGGNLLGIVVASQIWKLIGILINYALCRREVDGIYAQTSRMEINREILKYVWPSAWRSGVGRLMSYGLTQLSGLIFAQVGSSKDVATYLISLRLIQTIADFSRAPFYSKLPKLANLYAQNRREEEVALARKGMTLAFWTFVLGFVVLGLLGEPLLNLIDSNAPFANPMLWSLLGAGIFIERYGAMHIQLYSTTNEIKWHIANGVSGTIYLITAVSLLASLKVLAFPIAQIVGNLMFYSWYSAYYSYRTFGMRFWSFELQTSLVPLVILVTYSLLSILII